MSSSIRTGLLCCALICANSPLAQAQDESGLVELVVGLISDSDPDIRALAYEQIRTEAPGEAATKKFGELLNTLSGDAQIGLLRALGQRGDKAAQPYIVELLGKRPAEATQVAALTAVGQLGDSADCALLVKSISDDQPPAIRDAARRAMIALRGNEVSDAILGLMKTGSPQRKVRLIEILAERRTLTARPNLLQEAVGSNAKVRRAAMTALGKIGEAEQIAGMVQGVLKAEKGSERAAAEKNVMFVCQRIEPEDDRATPLLKAMDELSSEERIILLSTLGRVGGPQAMKEIVAAVKDRKTHSAGLRAMSNWPDGDIAAELIRVAKTDDHPSHRVTALRAIIRIAPLPDGRSNLEKLSLLKTAMALSQRDEDRLYALQRAAAIRSIETLRFLLPYLKQAKFAEAACLSTVELAHHRNLREPHKDEFFAALDQVLATSKNATVLDRAQRYKNNQTWVRPK